MRQLPERLFFVFFLLLSLPVFNTGYGNFAGNRYEWQEDRKGASHAFLLTPEMEEECGAESEEDEKEEGLRQYLNPESLGIPFRKNPGRSSDHCQ